MRRLLTAIVIAAVLGAAVWGVASTLGGVGNPNLGAEDAVVASCDTDGVSVDYTLAIGSNTFVVESVTVKGIADPCVGKTLQLFFTNGDNTIAGTLASTQVVADQPNDNKAVVAIPTPPPAKTVDGVHIAIN